MIVHSGPLYTIATLIIAPRFITSKHPTLIWDQCATLHYTRLPFLPLPTSKSCAKIALSYKQGLLHPPGVVLCPPPLEFVAHAEIDCCKASHQASDFMSVGVRQLEPPIDFVSCKMYQRTHARARTHAHTLVSSHKQSLIHQKGFLTTRARVDVRLTHLSVRLLATIDAPIHAYTQAQAESFSLFIFQTHSRTHE